MCLEVKEVVKSHLIPSALYQFCATEGESPLRVADGVVIPTDRQTWSYLLCGECEGVLNGGGETWTIEKLATLKNGFPLYELLTKSPSESEGDSEGIFLTASNPLIDVEKLTHFAVGIFWKASVASWRRGEKEPKIDLGPYSDALRRWLRGETAFPRHICLTVTVSKPEGAFITLCLPAQTECKDWPAYLLHVPGVLFVLSVGKRVPMEMRKTCFHESPDHFVFLSKQIDYQFHGRLGKQLIDSRKTKAYARLMDKRAKA